MKGYFRIPLAVKQSKKQGIPTLLKEDIMTDSREILGRESRDRKSQRLPYILIDFYHSDRGHQQHIFFVVNNQ
jgi:hypothetical protein